MWGSGNPHATVEHIRDSPEVNVWCGLWRDLLVGTVFFADATVPSSNYLDMLEKNVYPQLQELQPAVFFQQDGATSRCSLTVRASLNQHFPNRLTGCAGPISWPTRSPDITPCDFFLWVYVKDCVYWTSVANINDLKDRTAAAIAKVDVDFLQRILMELEYRLDIVRVTKGVHVECL
jgi:hypothetical protein